jgi:hypothetical protein
MESEELASAEWAQLLQEEQVQLDPWILKPHCELYETCQDPFSRKLLERQEIRSLACWPIVPVSSRGPCCHPLAAYGSAVGISRRSGSSLTSTLPARGPYNPSRPGMFHVAQSLFQLPKEGASTARPAVAAPVELQLLVQLKVGGPAEWTCADRLPGPGYRRCLQVSNIVDYT